MKKQEILNTIKSLSASQGFYGRLYHSIKDNDKVLTFLENQNFSDAVDLILFLET